MCKTLKVSRVLVYYKRKNKRSDPKLESEIIKDSNKAKVIGTNVLDDAIDYYSQKLEFITVHHNK